MARPVTCRLSSGAGRDAGTQAWEWEQRAMRTRKLVGWALSRRPEGGVQKGSGEWRAEGAALKLPFPGAARPALVPALPSPCPTAPSSVLGPNTCSSLWITRVVPSTPHPCLAAPGSAWPTAYPQPSLPCAAGVCLVPGFPLRGAFLRGCPCVWILTALPGSGDCALLIVPIESQHRKEAGNVAGVGVPGGRL